MPLNPLDWSARPLLTLYVAVALLCLVGAGLLERRARRGRPASWTPSLDVAELAFLAGGRSRLLATAMVGYLTIGAAEIGRWNRLQILAGGLRPPRWLEPFGPTPPGRISLRQFFAMHRPATNAVAARLAQKGLVMGPGERRKMVWRAVLLVSIPLALGTAKAFVGHARGRPIGILSVLLMMTVFAGATLLSWLPFRTALGQSTLDREKEANARAARAPTRGEVALAFALTGAAALAGTPWAAFARGLEGSNGCGGGGCGSGGGGGGCGGCSG